MDIGTYVNKRVLILCFGQTLVWTFSSRVRAASTIAIIIYSRSRIHIQGNNGVTYVFGSVSRSYQRGKGEKKCPLSFCKFNQSDFYYYLLLTCTIHRYGIVRFFLSPNPLDVRIPVVRRRVHSEVSANRVPEVVMIFEEHANNHPTNDTTPIGCLHGISTFTKLYTLTILDDCFSLNDLRVVLIEALYAVSNFVSFDQFQIKIFNFLVLFECLLLVLLIFIWAKYHSDIYERFLLSGTYLPY